MKNWSKLAGLPGQWGLLKVVAGPLGDRIVEIWGKLIRQGKGVKIQYVNQREKIVSENHHNRNVVSWVPHYDKR